MAKPNLTNNPYSSPNWYYPSTLGSIGEEPYIIFEVRDSVAKAAKTKCVMALYMPPSIKVQYDTHYEDLKIGTLQIMDSFNMWKNEPIHAAAEQMGKGGLGVVNMFSRALQLIQSGNADAESELERTFRKIVNPHMAPLFKGVGFRQFTFDFKMMAKTPEESEQIRNIIFRFKYHMHPKLGNGGEIGSKFLTYPDNFIIGLFSPADKYLFKISTSVLLNMKVDYAGSNVPCFFTKTGAPVDITMSLTFKELEWMTKERIASGY